MTNKIAIFSDLHLGVHQNSNFWLDVSIEWVKWFKNELQSKNIDSIIFCGDMFHYRDEVSLLTLSKSQEILNLLKDFKIIMITGNHDCYYKDSSEINSLSLLKGWDNIKVYDSLTTNNINGKNLTFCPWGTKISSIPESDIIFGHFELKNFKMNAHKICEDGEDPHDLAKKASLIFSGHFHLNAERKIENSKIVYIGNPFQMDFGDIFQQKGYYILDLDTNSYEFITNNNTPKHMKIFLSKLIKLDEIDNNFNSFLPNHIVKFIIDKNISTYHLDLLVNKMMSFKPLDLQVEYDVNYNKLKVSDVNDVSLGGVDVVQAIEEFVNLLDINNKKDVVEYVTNLYNRSKL